MPTRSLEKAIRALLEPEIAGGLSAFDDVEILLAAWKEMHRECAEQREQIKSLRAALASRGEPAAPLTRGPEHQLDAGDYRAVIRDGVPMIERTDTVGAVLAVAPLAAPDDWATVEALARAVIDFCENEAPAEWDGGSLGYEVGGLHAMATDTLAAVARLRADSHAKTEALRLAEDERDEARRHIAEARDWWRNANAEGDPGWHVVHGDVAAFHMALDIPIGDSPAIRRPGLRAELIRAEAREAVEAIEAGDLVETIKELCDLLCVVYGAALEFGVELAPFWDEVHRSNMAKMGGPVREDGKRLKPDGWRPPNIAGVLARENEKWESALAAPAAAPKETWVCVDGGPACVSAEMGCQCRSEGRLRLAAAAPKETT